MSETQSAPQLSGKMFLFERPELMNKEQHGDLGFQKIEKRFNYCAKARAVPVTVSEIPAAMKDYPIIFVSGESPIPLAVVGLIDDVNLFIDENGNWEENRYVPGYVRRYPFGVATENSGERLAIVIDAAYEGFTKGGEFPLFENGEPSASTQQAIEFCKTFEQDRAATDAFGARVKELDLIQGQSAQFTPQGQAEPRKFADYYGIDEAKFRALTDEQIIDMHKANILPLVYAMIMSMGNWRTLLQRRARRFNLTDENVLKPALN